MWGAQWGRPNGRSTGVVILPAILPGLLVVLRFNLFGAWMVVLIAEATGVGFGLGQVMMMARNTFNPGLVFFTIVVLLGCWGSAAIFCCGWYSAASSIGCPIGPQGWPMSEPAVRCRGVGKIWAARTDRAHEALRGIELTISPGEFVVLLGPSGCGKSTLLYLIAGLEQPTAGDITALGVPVTGPAPDRSMIFQETSLFPWLSVWQNVSFGLSLRGVGKAEQRDIARQVLFVPV